MSRIPFYFSDMRTGVSIGDSTLINGITIDGVFCKHSQANMGLCSEHTI